MKTPKSRKRRVHREENNPTAVIFALLDELQTYIEFHEQLIQHIGRYPETPAYKLPIPHLTHYEYTKERTRRTSKLTPASSARVRVAMRNTRARLEDNIRLRGVTPEINTDELLSQIDTNDFRPLNEVEQALMSIIGFSRDDAIALYREHRENAIKALEDYGYKLKEHPDERTDEQKNDPTSHDADKPT